MITAREIITEWLNNNGYDGLFNIDGECGCIIGDLIPCGEDPSSCEAGHQRIREDGTWEIYEKVKP